MFQATDCTAMLNSSSGVKKPLNHCHFLAGYAEMHKDDSSKPLLPTRMSFPCPYTTHLIQMLHLREYAQINAQTGYFICCW